MSGWLVALDFGTTATAVAVRSGDTGQGRALVFGDGASTVPSSVFAESDGRLLVGTEADNEAESRLDAFEPTPKRRVADGVIRLGDQDFGVTEVMGAVLAPVLGEAMQQHNNTVPDRVVLTHPVAWRARRRAVLADALKAAAARLGVELPEPVFVAEPVAAAQWYAHTDPPAQGAYFAVYDLGGGTFDTTVLQATADGFEVVASGGVDPLGGFDFDAALFDYLGTKYIAPADSRLWAGLSLPGQPDPELARQRRRLQQRVGLLKLGLSTSPDKQIQLPGVTGAVVVTRGEYEALIAGQIDNTVGELEDTIADAGLTADKLTAIYRIGGAARTPLVSAALDRFKVPVKVLDQPKLVVAQGAATPPQTPASTPAATAEPAVASAPGPPKSESSTNAAAINQTEALSPRISPHASAANGGSEIASETGMTRFIYGALGILAPIVVIVLIVGIVHITRGQTSSSNSTTSNDTSSGPGGTSLTAPDGAGSSHVTTTVQPTRQLTDPNQLLAVMPSDANCRPSTPENGAVAAVDCSPPGTGGMSVYSYTDADKMNSYFNSYFDGSNKSYPPQQCPYMGQSPQYWQRSVSQERNEGKVGCGTVNFTNPPTPYLTFTIDSELVVAYIQGTAGGTVNPLYQWWAANYQ